MQVLTKVDLVIAGALAPSTKLTATEVRRVLCFLFGVKKHDLAGIVDEMVKAKVSIEQGIASYESKAKVKLDSTYELYTTMLEKHQAATLHLTDKEASGSHAFLGNFMVCVKEEIQKLQPNITFKVDYSFYVHPEKTYATDSAVLYSAHDDDDDEMIPCFVVEYKPRVPQGLHDQEPFHLSEVFLQAFYLRRKGHKHPILHCLTDFKDFHYFLITDSRQHPAKLELVIEKYWYVACDLKKPAELLKNMKGLCYTLSGSNISVILTVSNLNLNLILNLLCCVVMIY